MNERYLQLIDILGEKEGVFEDEIAKNVQEENEPHV